MVTDGGNEQTSTATVGPKVFQMIFVEVAVSLVIFVIDNKAFATSIARLDRLKDIAILLH